MSAIEDEAMGEAIGLHSASALHRRRGIAAADIGPQLRRHVVQALLLGGDAASYLIAHVGIQGLGLSHPDEDLARRSVALVAILCLAQFAAASLYPGYGLHPHEHLRRRSMITITTAATASGFAALLLPDRRMVVGLVSVLLLALVLQPLLRSILRHQLWRHGLWGTDAVILADPEMGSQVTAYFREHWELGLVPAPRPSEAGSADARPPVAVLAARAMPPREELTALLRNFEWVIVLADLPSLRISGLQPCSFRGRIGITLRGGRSRPAYHLLRRLADLTIALTAVVMFAPVMLAAALAIWIVDPGPVIYRQAREGARGRTLQLLKLRTMYQDAEKRLEELLSADPVLRAEWETHYKLRNDPRILPLVGQFLRSSSCDELPQFFNVILGDMSIVGPRPFPDYHLAAMDEEFRAKRRSVMPGLTGLWQVSSRSTADVGQQQQLDEFYIDNRSFWFDAHIILRTFRAVLGRNGAY